MILYKVSAPGVCDQAIFFDITEDFLSFIKNKINTAIARFNCLKLSNKYDPCSTGENFYSLP